MFFGISRYSLHCGGIVYYPEGVPEELKLKQVHDESHKNGLSQIVLNKYDVGNNNQFKIDILSSRGLAQLHQALEFKNIDFPDLTIMPFVCKKLTLRLIVSF